MLSIAQAQIRETARRFAQRELSTSAAARDATHRFPEEALQAAGAAGLMGILVDPAFGGAGADYVGYAQAMTEIAAADGAASTVMSVHNGLVCLAIQRYATPAIRDCYLEPLATGRMLGCFCLTEPDAGSDASAIKTRAVRDGDNYVLNGQKQFITSGKSADIAIIFAVTDPAAGKRGITAFAAPTAAAGYRAATVERTMGQRSSDHCHVVFDDFRLSVQHRLGEEGEGYRIALANLESGRIGVAAQALGMARSAYEIALRYAKERRTFGKPIIEHQAVAFRLADMALALHAAELMIWRAASLKDEGRPCLCEASMAKLYASERAEKICSDAIQTLGGYGYLEDFQVERIYRDVRVCKIYEGTSDIQRLVIARELRRDRHER